MRNNKSERIKVSEVFESLQGEGKDAGIPMLFIRLSGCTRKCKWCDSMYNVYGKWIRTDSLVRRIKRSKLDVVCWTGGEPLKQKEAMYSVMNKVKSKYWHLETNGDRFNVADINMFRHISISPKDRKVAKNMFCNKFNDRVEIKVVTDLDNKVGVNMIPYADTLMPLSVGDFSKSKIIQRKVWDYCVKHNLRYSPRLQVEVWGLQKRRK